MGFILLSCPNCGGEIELDDRNEFGHCLHCGRKVILKEEVRKGLRSKERLNNLMELARSAHAAKDAGRMERYADKILEHDIKNPFGWLIRGSAAAFENRFNSSLVNWDKALGLADDRELKGYVDMIISDFVLLLNGIMSASVPLSPEVNRIVLKHIASRTDIGLTYFCDTVLDRFRKDIGRTKYRKGLYTKARETVNLIFTSAALECDPDDMLKKVRASMFILNDLRERYG